jgi:hypothetical protein
VQDIIEDTMVAMGEGMEESPSPLVISEEKHESIIEE